MAIDAFIKIGDISGESTDPKHKDEIRVLSWSWSASFSGSTHTESGGDGELSVHDLHLTKNVDRATPTLLDACVHGTPIKNCVLTIRKAGKKPIDYITLILSDCIITHISNGGGQGLSSGDGGELQENISINFARYIFSYVPIKDGAGTPPIKFGWDIPLAKEP